MRFKKVRKRRAMFPSLSKRRTGVEGNARALPARGDDKVDVARCQTVNLYSYVATCTTAMVLNYERCNVM